MTALTMRPTGLGHGVYKDSVNYSVLAGAWNIGRIYDRRGFSDAARFFWSLHGIVLTRPTEIHTDGPEPTFEMAKARLKRWSEGTEAERPGPNSAAPSRSPSRPRRSRVRRRLHERSKHA
jgi:hypothetical protein